MSHRIKFVMLANPDSMTNIYRDMSYGMLAVTGEVVGYVRAPRPYSFYTAGESGTRGWLAALDVKTGNELWRWYAVPKPGEPGSETWKDKNNAWKTGGGGIWQTGSYDPATRLTIWGTGNPMPQYDPQARPGDNLYTDSVVALDIDTGKLVWYFQYTPNDGWDYDEIGVHMLYDATINGETRKVVGHFARNGYFYSLDRRR